LKVGGKMIEENHQNRVVKNGDKTYFLSIQDNHLGEKILLISELNENPKTTYLENQHNRFIIDQVAAIGFTSAVFEMVNLLLLSQYSKKGEI
jgi:hypothetical protein